ncbi:MAG: hypothetical protein Q9209_001131 [Squamulea sp. 1 TL-2023]
MSTEELDRSPSSRRGPFGYEFPGDLPPPQASGPPLLNPSEDRVLNSFIKGVGSDQRWLDDELLLYIDDSEYKNPIIDARPPMPPPVQHIMTSLPAPGAHCGVPANQTFHEPLGISEVAFYDAMVSTMPVSSPYTKIPLRQMISRDPGTAFLSLSNFNGPANVIGPDRSYFHPVFGTMTYTMIVEYLQSVYRYGPDGQDAWSGHEYPDRTIEPMLGLTRSRLNQRCAKENLVQFGSDLHFEGDHFVAPNHHQTEARLRNKILGQVQGLFATDNIGESRAPTPNAEAPSHRPPLFPIDIVHSASQTSESEDYGSLIQKPSMSSPTRPKATMTKKGHGAASTLVVKKATRSQKTKGKKHINLSNEQRVDNHRQSEQRRRDEIRNSYVAMKATIPGMGDKKTKGAEMQYTVAWMRQTLKENERLHNLLHSVTEGV